MNESTVQTMLLTLFLTSNRGVILTFFSPRIKASVTFTNGDLEQVK